MSQKSYLLLLLLFSSVTSLNWLVLIAGSYTYPYYRHQSDLYRLYQIALKNGIPKSRIIVFSLDDIVQNSRNPIRGKMFNKKDGPDVYNGVEIDFYGADITVTNVAAAIIGEKKQVIKWDERTTGKICNTTKDDNIFIYFNGYAEREVIYLPDDIIKREELYMILEGLHEKGNYNKVLFYMDCPEALSMFEPHSTALAKWRIYALAGTEFDDEAWKEKCDMETQGKQFGVCLADEFSLRVFDDWEEKDLDKYTIGEQFDYLYDVLKVSSVHQYGDRDIAKLPFSEFLKG